MKLENIQIIAKKNTLKGIALSCRDEPPEIKYNPKFEQWYSHILDIIDIKIFKPSLVDNNKTKKIPKKCFYCDAP